ncbi:dihydrodipicolinate synthase family protein [Microbacterium sp. Root61]|uniref:dihydrodipicolinate synthase family protein n=1 Tax=Microbacterium sp. Root61 TaxID=1736570 RepID=UPI0009E66584|nr:dihydrodipicolinate synthase family protein [Microbacterium sp. Root61]
MTAAAPATLPGMPQHVVMPPMVTPLQPGGDVDTASAASLLRHFRDAGVDGVLLLGSSGENALLPLDQKLKVVEEGIRVRADAGGFHIMAGITAMGPADAVVQARALAELQPDSILVPAPMGFPFSPSELHDYFARVCDATDIPVFAYEVPARTHTTLGSALLGRLADEGRIAGIKDSSGQIGLTQQYTALTKSRPDLVLYTGMEDAIDAVLLAGGDGAIPGLANLFPEFHLALVRLAREGRWDAARAVQERINTLIGIYFAEVADASFSAAFFAIVKEALVQRGIIEHAVVSAPFTPCADQVRDHVARFLTVGQELRADLDDLVGAPV